MYIIKRFIEPKTSDNDSHRREFIFNILIVAIIVLAIGATISNLISFFLLDAISRQNSAISLLALFFVLSLFVVLYLLSRKGFFILASYILLTILFFLGYYMWYRWGVDVPFGLLIHALVIIISGILISTRFAFLTTGIIGVIMLMIGYWQQTGVLVINQYWKSGVWTVVDTTVVIIIYTVIATVSWLSNREIEKSLARARRSEVDLKKERDSLEITVEARTRELKETQAEKMTQLYRFAEFGRLSSGLFHDLINPLTAVSLNMEKVKNMQQSAYPHIEFAIQNTDIAPISETAMYLDKAIFAAKKMEDMVSAVRKQLSRQENKTLFSVNEEITQALEVLSYKAQKAGVAMRLFSRQEIKTYGDAIKFNQVALNLVANAIDSYLKKRDGETRTVTASLSQKGSVIIFEVKDKGVGISEENKPKLFEPFFTTKEEGYGLGIGLSIVKRIIEKDFGGTIDVKSQIGRGSVFAVKFPQKQNE